MEKIKLEDIKVGLVVYDDGGDKGVISNFSDIHNVEVKFNGGVGLFCLEPTCYEREYAPLYYKEPTIKFDKHFYTKETFGKIELFDTLLSEVPWINKDAPRDECFMSSFPLEYTYGKGFTRSYKSIEFHPEVFRIMTTLNYQQHTSYNVCFLNYYKSDKEHLGWHADDSPEMDTTHPIAVISFGAEREIWVKEKGFSGNIPDHDKYNLPNGSLFTMLPGMQETHLHKIPKGDRVLGGRISLTFRKYKF